MAAGSIEKFRLYPFFWIHLSFTFYKLCKFIFCTQETIFKENFDKTDIIWSSVYIWSSFLYMFFEMHEILHKSLHSFFGLKYLFHFQFQHLVWRDPFFKVSVSYISRFQFAFKKKSWIHWSFLFNLNSLKNSICY